MTVYPGAVFRPVVNHGSGLSKPLGLVLHVQVGTGSLYGWFNNPSSQVSAHWWVSASGTVEQYVSCDVIAWAQAAGNTSYCSVETEGQPDTPLTDAQIDALAGIYRWGHDTFGWPFSPADTPGEPGLGWHGMGGAAWGNHPGCPSTVRVAARPTILQKAAGLVIPGGDTQPPLNPPTPLEDDLFVVIETHENDNPASPGHSATFDGTHKVPILKGTTFSNYIGAGIKAVGVAWDDYNAIPNAT